MTLTITELGSVASELNDLLAGGLIQEIRQPSNDSILLNIYFGRRYNLFIKASPRFSRIHLTEEIPKADYRNPPPFMMKLRKEIKGGYITAIKQLYTDRVVGIFIKKGESKYNLLFECSGHHPNIFLLDAYGKILAMIKKSMSYRRKLVVGAEYKKPIPVPQMETMKFRFLDNSMTLSAQIERFYKEIEEGERFRKEKARMLSAVRALKKHEEVKLVRIREDLKKAEEMTAEYIAALKAMEEAWQIPPESREYSADVDGKEITLRFKEGLSPMENLNEIISKRKRFRNAVEFIRARIENVKKEINRLNEMEKRVLSAVDSAGLEGIEVNGVAIQKVSRQNEKRSEERKPYKEFIGTGGYRILVGKGGRDNHELTFRIARERDIWLHALGFAGAHVVILRDKNKEVPMEAIREAAILAAKHSKAKRETMVDVIYTERRFIRPIKGAEPGKVRVINSKTITVRADL